MLLSKMRHDHIMAAGVTAPDTEENISAEQAQIFHHRHWVPFLIARHMTDQMVDLIRAVYRDFAEKSIDNSLFLIDLRSPILLFHRSYFGFEGEIPDHESLSRFCVECPGRANSGTLWIWVTYLHQSEAKYPRRSQEPLVRISE
jgi:hypothetical protein